MMPFNRINIEDRFFHPLTGEVWEVIEKEPSEHMVLVRKVGLLQKAWLQNTHRMFSENQRAEIGEAIHEW